MEVGHVSAPNGIIYPQTTSYFCTLAWCTAGQLIFEGNGWSLQAEPGQAIIADHQLNFTTLAGAEGCDAYYLLMDGPAIDRLLLSSNLWSGTFSFTDAPIRWLNWLATHIQDADSYATLSSTGQALFIDLQMQAKSMANDPLVWDAICYLQQHWNHSSTNVERVLRHLGVSRSSLSPRFKAETGSTIKEYLYAIRYRQAVQMLEQKSISIATIAKRCGIPDPAHFSFWFRKQSGKSPRAFKRKASR